MFWFYVILVVLTYPIVFVGSFLLGVIVVILSDGHGAPNPFVSPARVYSAYRTTIDIWITELIDWYRREKNK